MNHHNAQVDPIFKRGPNQGAVLLLHGFTGSPDSMRSLANHINGLGFTVSVPLLAGHGTTKEALAQTGWPDWYDTALRAFLELKERHNRIAVAGLSLGSLLGLKLAQDYPQALHALGCLATPLFLQAWARLLLPILANTSLGHLYPYQKKYAIDVKDPQAKVNYWNVEEMPISCVYSIQKLQAIVRRDLVKVTAPVLLLHSRYDSTAPYESMGEVARRVTSKTTETITLENCFHLITMDYEKDIVAQRIGQFVARFL